VAAALGASRYDHHPAGGKRARSAAYNHHPQAEGAALHLDRLRNPALATFSTRTCRDRLIARRHDPPPLRSFTLKKVPPLVSERRLLRLFQHVDAILAPATPSRRAR